MLALSEPWTTSRRIELGPGGVAADEPVYWISSGFGSLAQTAIAPERRVELQRAPIRSHAAGLRAGAGHELQPATLPAPMPPTRFSAWKRTAIVTDVDWIAHASGMFPWLTPGELMVGDLDSLDEAKAWVAG